MGCSCTKPLVREEDVDSPTTAAAAAGPPRRHSGVQGKAAPAPAPVPATYRRESGSWRKVSGKFEAPIVSTGDPARSKSGQLVLGGPIAIHRKEVPRTLPKHIEAEQAAAGWPAWLVAVAGEAIKGWIPRRADSFEKLDKIGQGTYSNVYKARDLDTGKIVALKKVRFDNREPESVRFMAREIQVLRRLHHPNIIKLEGLVTSRMACSLYLVFEYMEHDLAGLVACPGITFSESQVKCYMQQLLRGLDHCHSRGVLHRDIKGSNLLIDNDGTLKIADFGLATFFNPDEKQQLTSRVVTLWYRPPELLLGATEYGVAVDLWSTGCILAELLASKPIMPGRTEVEQLHKIFKLCGSPSEDYWKRSKLPHATIFKPQQPYKRCLAETFKDFPTSALALLETLLSIEPVDRGTSAIALKTDFFNTKPLPCDPSILPKYPPSKELDAKLRDEEARRQRAAGGRARNVDMAKKIASREQSGKAVPVPDANAELATSLQKCRVMNGAAKCKSEKFNVHLEDSEVGFSINPPRLAEGSVKVAQKDDAIVVPWHPPQATGLSAAPLPPPHLLGLAKQDAIQNKETCETRHREKSHRIVSHSGYTDETVKPAIPDDIPMRNSDDFKDQDLSPHYNAGLSGFGNQSGRVHFSGPLLPNTANIEEILGEHERQIQKAVRRARYDKVKGQRNPGTYKARSSNRSGEVPIFGSTYNNLRSSSDQWKDSKPLSTTDGGPESGLASVIENDEKEQET